MRARQARSIADTLFDDEIDGVALLDAAAYVTRANFRFTALTTLVPGKPAMDALPPAVWASLGRALRFGRPISLPMVTEVRESTPSLVNPAGSSYSAVRRVLRLALLPLADGGALLRVSDRTHEQDLEDRLGQSQRLQAVGELAGGIAHDFNNLLTAIIGAADDLRARSEQGGADDDDLIQIQESAERGASLVRHLLAFSRQQTLQPQVVALNDAITETAKLVGRLLGGGVTLELALEEPGRRVRIDPTQLAQVLMNLAVNARNAMPSGGRLTIATGHRLVLLAEHFGGETLPAGRYASLSITDTGTGIPANILPRIFEPFFTTRRDSGGTGLGLSTVHGIIRQSGGYMAVESTGGVGTRFDILLPRHEEVDEWIVAPVQPAGALLRRPVSRTVLLVDDEAPVRRLAERVLTRAGWNVVAAPSAEDALDLVEGGDLASVLGCVISDVIMPGMNGPAFVQRLREDCPELPAILMSGYADAKLRGALEAADIVFLPKPFAMSDLAHAVETLVQ